MERLTPRDAVAFLNAYFSVVVAPLAADGAVLAEERAGFVGPAVVQLRGRDAAIAVRYLPIARPG